MTNQAFKEDSSVFMTWLLFALIFAAYLPGLFVDVMDVDASQYASISMEMLQSGEFLQVLHRHSNYLDKPPLLFWLSALSFKIFGYTNWAYKLPSFLFTILGVYSLYRLALIYYVKQVAVFAALMLASCQAYFSFNNDVRTDTILAAAVIFSIWNLCRFNEYQSIWGFVFGFVGIGLAMLAKGPIGAMVPVLAIGTDLLFKRRWKQILNPVWIPGIAIIALILAPMCYGLFLQFGVEGLKFFFWTQSFGRITGENEWRNDAGYFYFVHTFLWAFLPWTILAIGAYVLKFKTLIFARFKPNRFVPEFLSVGGVILPFIALSASKFKLPHYIFVFFPLVTLAAASFIVRFDGALKFKSAFTIAQKGISILFPVAISAMCIYTFGENRIWFFLWLAVLGILLIYNLFFAKTPVKKLLYAGVVASVIANFAMNVSFYPRLLQFQAGSVAARKISQSRDLKDREIYLYEMSSHAFDFYSREIHPYCDAYSLKGKLTGNQPIFLFADERGIETLHEHHFQYVIIEEFLHHHPTLLTIEFLNPATRTKSLEKRYLVEVSSHAE